MSAVSSPAHAVETPRAWWRHPAWALGGLVGLSAVLAVLLHRNGHTQGDDFALYLRQARSIFDGDIGTVVADNRFTVVNSASGFSPIAYPWGWPLLLAPFVKLWGLDYDKLTLLDQRIATLQTLRHRLAHLPLGAACPMRRDCEGTAAAGRFAPS